MYKTPVSSVVSVDYSEQGLICFVEILLKGCFLFFSVREVFEEGDSPFLDN